MSTWLFDANEKLHFYCLWETYKRILRQYGMAWQKVQMTAWTEHGWTFRNTIGVPYVLGGLLWKGPPAFLGGLLWRGPPNYTKGLWPGPPRASPSFFRIALDKSLVDLFGPRYGASLCLELFDWLFWAPPWIHLLLAFLGPCFGASLQHYRGLLSKRTSAIGVPTFSIGVPSGTPKVYKVTLMGQNL